MANYVLVYPTNIGEVESSTDPECSSFEFGRDTMNFIDYFAAMFI